MGREMHAQWWWYILIWDTWKEIPGFETELPSQI
jgi:hypothetical protein